MKPLLILIATLLAAALLAGSCRPAPPAIHPTATTTYTIIPSPTEPPTPTPDKPYSSLIFNKDGSNDAYRAIGRMLGDKSCTAVYINTADIYSDKAVTAPAYVLTNAHCLASQTPNEVVLDRPMKGYKVIFNYFVDSQQVPIAIPVKTVAFSSLKGVDLAVLELDATVADMMGRNIRPLKLMDDSPKPGEAVEVIGAPLPNATVLEDEAYLRRSNCALSGESNILEGQWVWYQLLRNECPDLTLGSAGSPVIDTSSGEVAGIISSTTLDSEGLVDCAQGRPCEMGAGGLKVKADTSYAVPVKSLPLCFDYRGIFDVYGPACPLDDGRQLSLDPGAVEAVNPDQPDPYGNLRSSWDVSLSSENFSAYRYKVVKAGRGDCRQIGGYSDPLSIQEAAQIVEPLPAGEGFYILCLLGGENLDLSSKWQPVERASQLVVQIDRTPPSVEPDVKVEKGADFYQVGFRYALPELAVYRVKFGPPGSTACRDPQDYFPQRMSSLILTVAGGPYRLCVIGYDAAGNPTPPLEKVLD